MPGGGDDVIIKACNLLLITVTLIVLLVASFSASWTKTSTGGIVYKTNGLYFRCGTSDCDYNNRPSGWHETARYLVFVMWMDLCGTIAANCCALFIRPFRLSKVFALLYFAAGVMGVMVLIIFPIGVSPIGKDNIHETWFGYGYWTFLAGVFFVLVVSVQCWETTPETFPGF